MGNTATKEARPPVGTSGRSGHGRGSSGGAVTFGGHSRFHNQSDGSHPGGSPRHFRGSRPDLSFLGIGPAVERDTVVERKETKQERDARRLARERAVRIKERERSMREEHVDGGYLVTQGVYTGTEDFNKAVVRQLMIERRLAPFWKGLEEFSESWTEHQLMAAAKGLPIPAPDEIPPELEYKLTPPRPPEERDLPEQNLNNLTVPITSRSQSYNSDTSFSAHPVSPSISLQPQLSPSGSGSPGPHLFRGRAKTLASPTASSKNSSLGEMSPREIQLPKDPFVNGQPIEAYLYKNPIECPICFLFYPPYLNRTRCCDQLICSECFVQIKRANPHPPEHEHRDSSLPPPPDQPEGQLISEPAACPFCVQPDFGVSYVPPPFRRGLSYLPSNGLNNTLTSPASSTSSVASRNANPQSITTRCRANSLSANSPTVITTDKIRPDWAQKLQMARAQAARRSAAATALHAAAYVNAMSNPSESRGMASSSRRMLRRTTGHGSDSPTNIAGSVALLAERQATAADRENDPLAESTFNLAPARASSRRSRVDELEEMMMMEAIRLSLASEEERRRKEEKEAKKEAKRREKEAKRAEKLARKNALYSNNPSSVALDAAGNSTGRPDREPPLPVTVHEPSNDKGKAVDRPASSSEPLHNDPQPPSLPALHIRPSEDGDLSSVFAPSSASAANRSHLRHLSSTSSSNSSLVESTSGELIGSTSAPNSTNSAIEPVLNFRSLDAVIGDEDKSCNEHLEGVTSAKETQQPSTDDATRSSTNPNLEPEVEPAPSEHVSPVQEGPGLNKDEDGFGDKELQSHSLEITCEGSANMETTG
ncbi:C2H2 zinc finger protein [Blastomyces dermatitidis ATCC 18188]|uniref:Protein SIP5 n=1 Tax=Ajellomyces dermatitidis (strain ATCC 18188 / CBS 674.68) TaxID=653446 RepID=F2T5Y8_AJEDA|nr:C2H2 zinc finger protein [Blastomyces dermatitidis ATCC 18188]